MLTAWILKTYMTIMLVMKMLSLTIKWWISKLSHWTIMDVIKLPETAGPAHPETPVQTGQYRFSKQNTCIMNNWIGCWFQIHQTAKKYLVYLSDSQQDGCELSRKITHNLISKRIYLYEKKDYKTFFKTIHEMFPAQHWHCEIPCVQDWCGEMVTVTEIQRQLFKVLFYFPKFWYSPFSSIFYIYFISICIITFISFFS